MVGKIATANAVPWIAQATYPAVSQGRALVSCASGDNDDIDSEFDPSNLVLEALAGAEPPGPPSDEVLACFDLTDLGNVERLRARYGANICYTEEFGWLAWDGARWVSKGGESAVMRYIHLTVKALKIELSHARKYIQDGVTEKEFRTHVNASASSGSCNAIRDQARHVLLLKADEFDRDPLSLNVANGTLRLNGKVQLAPHRRDDHITKVCDVTYDPKASCPHFMRFLNQVQPGIDEQLFLQTFFGYTLSGMTAEQVFCIFGGKGSNGKSTLVDIVATIMGDYSITSPIATFLFSDRSSGSGPSPDVARLPGARLVRTSEPNTNVRLSESVIKQWTGGEAMTGRKLHQDFVDFRPVGKLIMTLNNMPAILGKDYGIRRRLLLLPFRQMFKAPDRNLKEKLLDERSGILNWLLDGWRLYQEGGLRVSAAMAAAKDAYFDSMDPIGAWANKHLHRRSDDDLIRTYRAKRAIENDLLAKDAYAHYKEACDASEEKPKSARAFHKRLRDMDFETGVSYGKDYYRNVRYLKDSDIEAAAKAKESATPF